MKRVAIITYHFSDNFGSILQAYALKKMIQKEGYECDIIDYRKAEVKELYRIFKPNTNKFNIITNLYSVLYYGKLARRKVRYEKFRTKVLQLTEKKYEKPEELHELNMRYDVFVCGSDQVWNTEIVDFDLSYVLHFADKKRISYAASCGPKLQNKENLEILKEDLSKFDSISVREESTKKVLEQLVKTEISVVVDPVLLLQRKEWDSLIGGKMIKEEYIFCYFPGGAPIEGEKISAEYAKIHKCKRILVMPEWRNIFRKGKKEYDAGPIEFLNLIKNAKHVFTSSFHGTAFSVIFNIPFSVVSHNKQIDQRIATLLVACSLEKSRIDTIRDIEEIDFNIVNEKIEKLRNESKVNFAKALEK